MKKVLETLNLKGLRSAPAQVFGAIRLLPLIKDTASMDLRLGIRAHVNPIGVVEVEKKTHYASYVPHAAIVQYSDDGSPLAALGSQLLRDSDKPHCFGVKRMKKMAKREAGDTIRFLPLHLAMESFLSICFAGPEIAWPEYTKRVLRQGLSPRVEYSFSGSAIFGLEEALRMFEIHEGQVGVALFAADALASIFVVPNPDDYRRMHWSLLRDFYGELIWQYANLFDDAMEVLTTIDETRVKDMPTLRAEAARARLTWDEAFRLLLDDAIGRPADAERVTSFQPFSLQRFSTQLQLDGANHIGEAIVRDDGRIEYLKTFRLSSAQSRRGYLLRMLSSHQWHLNDTCAALRCTRKQLIERLVHAGFGSLLKPEVINELRQPSDPEAP